MSASTPSNRTFNDVMVTMRDGIGLASDIYLPAGDGPFPVILERTPYGKSAVSRSEIDRDRPKPRTRAEVAAFFTAQGYGVVYQDCRGRHGSQGQFIKYLSDAEDGFDTIGWIMAQGWCDGRIGTMGLSYAAHTQMALACLAPKGLTTMIVDSGGFSNAFRCGIRQGGALEMKQATWAFKQAKESSVAQKNPDILAALEAEDIRAWFLDMPWREGHSPIRHVPEYEAYLFEQWRHGTFDDFWKQPGLYAAGYYNQIPDIPVLLLSSWYDVYVRTAFENHAGLTAPGRTSPVHVIMGPWLHGDRTLTRFGDADFGLAACFDTGLGETWLDYRLRWFERHLKGIVSTPQPAVRLFLMGGGSGRKRPDGALDHGGHWIEAESWPPPGMQTTLYLRKTGMRLSADADDAPEAALVFQHDPSRPVPSIGGALTSGEPVFSGGAFDQVEDSRFLGCAAPWRPLSQRPDVLSFQTVPLDTDTAVIGPVLVVLWIESTAPDTDFTAKLVDVYPPSADYPDGFAMILTDGIIRCRYRDSFEEPEFMIAGTIYRVEIELPATANLFRAGHSIRLDIASSNFPKFDVNPQSAEPEGRATHSVIARNTIHASRHCPSHISLHNVDMATVRDA